jgi:hypothetical protein
MKSGPSRRFAEGQRARTRERQAAAFRAHVALCDWWEEKISIVKELDSRPLRQTAEPGTTWAAPGGSSKHEKGRL